MREYDIEEDVTLSDLAFLSDFRDGKFRCERDLPRDAPWIDQIKVTANNMAPTVATAFLSMEEAGAFRFEILRSKGFFRLSETTALWAIRVGAGPQWPTGSLEEILTDRLRYPWLRTGYAPGAKVSNIVYWWLGACTGWTGRTGDPWGSAREQMVKALEVRELLDVQQVPTSMLGLIKWTSKRHTVPERTRLRVEQSQLSHWRLLETSQRERPELHHLLIKGINDGFAEREDVGG